MSEFSRRVNIEVFKDEPMSRVEFVEWLGIDDDAADTQIASGYQHYLDNLQPYWWHAQSPNGEILTNGEHYAHEAGAINSVELLFGDDTTMHWAPMYGEDRGERLLRYGKTDRDHQVAADATAGLVADGPHWHKPECRWVGVTPDQCAFKSTHYYCPHPEHACDCGVRSETVKKVVVP